MKNVGTCFDPRQVLGWSEQTGMRVLWHRRIAGVITLVLILCVLGMLMSNDFSGPPTRFSAKRIASKLIGHFAISASMVEVQRTAGASAAVTEIVQNVPTPILQLICVLIC